MLALLDREGARGIADAMIPRLLGATTRASSPSVVAHVRRLIEANAPGAIGDAIGCLMTRPDATPQLPSMTLPIGLIVGQEDELTPVSLHEQMQAGLPDATLVTIAGAGHLSNLEQPEVFNRALADFLSRLS
jgi:pimeloyl-ACP methyl ester carboxylesterase